MFPPSQLVMPTKPVKRSSLFSTEPGALSLRHLASSRAGTANYPKAFPNAVTLHKWQPHAFLLGEPCACFPWSPWLATGRRWPSISAEHSPNCFQQISKIGIELIILPFNPPRIRTTIANEIFQIQKKIINTFHVIPKSWSNNMPKLRPGTMISDHHWQKCKNSQIEVSQSEIPPARHLALTPIDTWNSCKRTRTSHLHGKLTKLTLRLACKMFS